MNFLGNLGIDVKLLVAQIVDFIILLVLLNWLVYKPLIRKIEKDEAELRAAEVENRRLAGEREKFRLDKERELAELRRHTETVLAEAGDMAEGIRRRARDEADHERRAVVRQIKERLAEINNVNANDNAKNNAEYVKK